MIWLILGVVLWSCVHFIPTLAQPLRQRLITGLGEIPYKIAFSLVVLLSLVLIVTGWRSTPQVTVYRLPTWSGVIGFLLMIIAFVLFITSNSQTVIKRYIRHPQLMAIVVWSVSHLITNGSTRALILFGGLGLWAIIQMPLINAREGSYSKPDAPGFNAELKGLTISAVVFIVVLFLHPYFAGVVAFPR